MGIRERRQEVPPLWSADSLEEGRGRRTPDVLVSGVPAAASTLTMRRREGSACLPTREPSDQVDYLVAFAVTRTSDACSVPPMSWNDTLTLSPAAMRSVIATLPPAACAFVPAPRPTTFVFESMVNV